MELLKKYGQSIRKLMLEAVSNDWSEDQMDESRFNFKVDSNGNVICIFEVNKDSNSFTVTAVVTEKETKFLVASNDGTVNEMSEKEFALEYYKDYDEFKKALKKRNEANAEAHAEAHVGESPEDKSESTPEITSFKDIITNNEDERLTREYNINDHIFVLKKLKDEFVPEFCQAVFESTDDDTKETVFNKALVYCKVGKCTVMKIVQFNAKGERLGVLTPSEFNSKNPEIGRYLNKAVIKFANYLVDMNIL